MRGAPFVLSFCFCLVASLSHETPAGRLARPDSTLVTSTEFGDTVWFQSSDMIVGPRYGYGGSRGGNSYSDTMKLSTAWARTRRTPVLIMIPERSPSPTAEQILDVALADPKLGVRKRSPTGEWQIDTREAGRFDDVEGRPLYGWEVDFPPSDQRIMRVVFAVIEFAGAVSGAPHHPRPYEIPVRDRHATARIVGEYRVNLSALRVERVRGTAETGR